MAKTVKKFCIGCKQFTHRHGVIIHRSDRPEGFLCWRCHRTFRLDMKENRGIHNPVLMTIEEYRYYQARKHDPKAVMEPIPRIGLGR